MGHERGVVGVVQRRMREEREGEQAREACACEALRWEKKNGEERPRLRLAFEGERGRRFRRFHVRYLRHSSFCSRALSRMHIRRGRRSVNSFPRKISSATKRILRQIVFANRPPQRTLTPLLSFLDVWTEDTEMRVMFLLLLFFFSSPVDCFGTESSSYKASNPAINRVVILFRDVYTSLTRFESLMRTESKIILCAYTSHIWLVASSDSYERKSSYESSSLPITIYERNIIVPKEW